MKHKLFSRFIGVLLAVVMLASLVSMPSLANTVPETDTTVAGQTQTVEQDQTVTDGTDGEVEGESGVPAAEGDEDTTLVEDDDNEATPPEDGAESSAPAEGGDEDTTLAGDDSEEGTEPSENGEESAEPAEDSTEGSASSADSGETTGDGEEPAEPANIADLTGEALLDALLAIEDDETLGATVAQLTAEQLESLEALGDDALQPLAERLESQTSVPSESAPVDTSVAAPFTTVGPILGIGSSMQPMMRSAALFQAAPQTTVTEPVEGLLISKNVSEVDNSGIYKIDLHAEAKSNIVSTAVPCDIILVLDRSGSMEDDGKDKDLIESAKKFVDTIAQNSPESRVAVVAYADDSDIYSGDRTAAGAFVDVSQKDDLHQDIENALNNPDGSTYSNKGLHDAYDIYQAISVDDPNYDNARAVVLFTDGIPGWNSTWLSNNHETAQNSIYWGQVLKADKETSVNVAPSDTFYGDHGGDFVEYRRVGGIFDWDWALKDGRTNMLGSGATIYTVGFGLPNNDVKINEYMYRLSSNRPDGTHVSEWGDGGYSDARTRDLPDGYYLTADNADELNQIFQQIAEQTGKPIENATVKDYISPYFQLVDREGNPINVGGTVQAEGYTGKVKQDGNGVYVEWEKVTLKPESADGSTEAQDFDATLYIKPKDAFMGGNDVPTNVYGPSGVYDEKGNCIGSFGQCQVNVDVRGSFTVQDQSIYLSQDGNAEAMIGYPETGPRPFVDLGNGAKSNDFVTIKYTINENGSSATYEIKPKATTGTLSGNLDLSDLTDCTDYTITCTVNEQPIAHTGDDDTATVHVYTPTVTWQDSTKAYNTDLNNETLLEDNYVKVEWSDSKSDGSVRPTGDAPELTYEFTYAPELPNSKLTAETNVTVSKVEISGEEYTNFVDHDWQNSTCACTTGPEDADFRIHLATGDLKIEKKIQGADGNTANAEETVTFLFQVKGNGKTYNAAVTVNAGADSGSVTLKNLPAGAYTITEIACPNGYESKTNAQSRTVSGREVSVEFTNQVKDKDYTHDDGMVINKFTCNQSGDWTWKKLS